MQRQSWGECPAACQDRVWYSNGWGTVTDGRIGSWTSCQKSHDSQQVRLKDVFNLFPLDIRYVVQKSTMQI